MHLAIYLFVLWLGTGVILAKESITECEPIYLRDSLAFIIVALAAPLIMFVMMVDNVCDKLSNCVLFKQKETNDQNSK